MTACDRVIRIVRSLRATNDLINLISVFVIYNVELDGLRAATRCQSAILERL